MKLESENKNANSWKITVVSPAIFVPSLEEIFYALDIENFPSISAFEIKGQEDFKLVEVYMNAKPDHFQIIENIKIMAGIFDVEPPEIDIQALDDIDWIAESQKILKPIDAGDFFLFGKHDTDKIPNGKIPILMEAGQAFGTGSHETTKGCLLAINNLRNEINPGKILDLGCGSGVLAIAMYKQWPVQITASDIDPVATKTASENLATNNVPERDQGVTLVTSNGFDGGNLSKNAPYDLIVANILAEPLVKLSEDIIDHLSDTGLIILSGLLKDQEKDVLSAYTEKNMELIGTVPINEWQTLIMKKKEK